MGLKKAVLPVRLVAEGALRCRELVLVLRYPNLAVAPLGKAGMQKEVVSILSSLAMFP